MPQASMLVLVAAIFFELVATVSLKLSEGFSRPLWLIPVALGYALAFYFLSLTLRSIPVGIAYAIWSGLGTIGITAAGYILFNQSLNGASFVGIALILIGVVVLNVMGSPASS
jgi:small multidrug resistance pump